MTSIIQIISTVTVTVISLLSIFVISQLYFNLCCNYMIQKQTNAETSSLPPITKNSPIIRVGSVSSNSAIHAKAVADVFNASMSSMIHTQDKENKIQPFFKRTTIIASTMFFIVSIFINIDVMMAKHQYWTLISAAIISNSCYLIGRITLCLIFIGRLYYTFKGSAFQISPYIIKSLVCAWCLMPISLILCFVSYKISLFLTITFGMCFLFIDIILSCVLLYIYLKKLSYIIKHGKKIGNSTHKMLISLTTRYALLYSVCFISTLMLFIMSIMTPFINVLEMNAQQELRFIWIFYSIDSFCNSLSLWLNLKFAKHWYLKLCKTCDNECKQCFSDSELNEEIIANDRPQIGVNHLKMESTATVKIPQRIVLTVKSHVSENSAIII